MDVKGILDKIEADAREAAAQTLEQAQARIDALRAANDAAQHQHQPEFPLKLSVQPGDRPMDLAKAADCVLLILHDLPTTAQL